MMKILRYKLSSILLIMSAFGCTASDIAPEKTEHELKPLTPVELRAKTTVNQLSADLLKAKLANALSDNAMVSSASLYYALSVLERGAGSHSNELLRTFLLEDDTETLAPLASAFANQIVYPAIADRPQYGQFLLANAIWATNGETNGLPFVFSQAFKQDAEKFYQASSYALDFMAKGASVAVNDWAYENTNGLIPNIMDDQTLQAFEWMITNAAYFEGAWSVPMQKLPANGQFEFRSLEGSRAKVESIRSEKFRARVLDLDDKSTLVAIPFDGGKYSFVAFMPPNEHNLEDANTERWILDTAVPELPKMIDALSKAAITHVTVQMPTFSFEDGFEMQAASELTHQLGLADLFKNSADFSRLVDTKKTALSLQRTKVGLIKQNSKIELDENGVKAAAVTLIAGVKATSAPRPFIPRALIMDRPFVFAIIENRSGTMLFNGVMTKPGTSATSGK